MNDPLMQQMMQRMMAGGGGFGAVSIEFDQRFGRFTQGLWINRPPYDY